MNHICRYYIWFWIVTFITFFLLLFTNNSCVLPSDHWCRLYEFIRLRILKFVFISLRFIKFVFISLRVLKFVFISLRVIKFVFISLRVIKFVCICLLAGVLFSQYGDSWRELRRFTLQSLRDFGVGKTSLQEAIINEVDALSTFIKTTNGKSMSMCRPLQKLVANVIYHIIFSNRYGIRV